MVSTYGRGAEVEAEIVSDIEGITFGGNHVLRLDYDFTQESGAANNVGTTGWQGNITEGTCFGVTDDVQLNVPGVPKLIGAWVYAPEGTPNLWMRARYGFNGNVMQFDFTKQRKDAADGIGGINWTGWKFVTADLPNNGVGEFSLKKGELIRLLALSAGATGNENGWWTVTGGYETDAEGNTVYATDEKGDQVPVLAKRRLEQSEIKGSLYFDDIQFLYENVTNENICIFPTCCDDGKRISYVKCSICGEILSEKTEIIPATNNHVKGNSVETIVVSPTCVEPGEKLVSDFCAVCGVNLSESTVVIPATGNHISGDPIETIINAPTCVAAGEKKYTTVCTVCGEILDETTENIPPTGEHTPGEPVTTRTAATCTTDGEERTVTKCTVCGEVLDQLVKVFPAGHKLVLVPAVAPTATKEGNIEYYVCSVCGKCFADANASNEIDEASAILPKTEEEQQDKCPYCGKTHTGTFGSIVRFFHQILYFFRNLFGG